MTRILQLSDFHLNKKTLKDWNSFLKESLKNKIEEISKEKPITLIAFTGDLLDKGGKDFGSADNAFLTFEKEIIEPILEYANLEKKDFFIVPGNHDIQRDLDGLREELGSKAYLTNMNNISDYFRSESKGFEGMKRIEAYKEFEKLYYKELNLSKNIENFSSSFIIEKNNIEIGVTCLNSSWRCFDNNDHGNLIIPLEDLQNQTNFIKHSDLKICLIHHPLDSLHSSIKSTISSHVIKDYDLLLFGHSHSTLTAITTGFSGRIFINMAPSGLNNIYEQNREFINGFTLIDYSKNEVCAEYFRYNIDLKTFVINTDAGKEGSGKFCDEIPAEKSTRSKYKISEIVEHIKDHHFEKFNNSLIGRLAEINTIKNLKESFILPPITDNTISDNIPSFWSLSDIIKSDWNNIFFGTSESGKTILLYRLAMEYIDLIEIKNKIPVFIDFEEIKNKDIITIIREFLSCKIDTVKELIKDGMIVLLIDNLNYSKYNIYKDNFNKIHKFLQENSSIICKATADDTYFGSIPIELSSHCTVPFKALFIKNLGAKEIKSLMYQWVDVNDSVEQEQKLEKLVNNFSSYSLPSTAFSVSLFLWSSEYSSTKPINHAVLLELYIEIILQKINIENIYRESFDFKNKCQLLANIAQEMLNLDKENYSITYSEYIDSIEKYLDVVGFDYDSNLIGEYLVKKRIIQKFQTNRVKFSYSCFFHFFLAKRMEYNSDFYSYVVSKDNFFRFTKELDYYSGLVRSDKYLLNFVHDIFKSDFKETDFIFSQMSGRWDDHFIVKEDSSSNDEYTPISRDLEISTIKENRPSEYLTEEVHNRRLSEIKNPSQILKKGFDYSLDRLLVIMSNVLRNSEGVEDAGLKLEVYSNLIKYSMSFILIYRESILDYVIENRKLPSSFPKEINFIHFLEDLPFYMQLGMSKNLASYKLSPIIFKKISSDFKGNSFTNSDLELFLSIALFSDVQGRDFPVYFKKFIKKAKISPVLNYAFYKLTSYYYKRTKEGSPNEEIYLDMLADLNIKSQKFPKRLKQQIMKSIQDQKKKFKLG